MQFDEILDKAYQQTYQGDYDLALYLLSDLNRKYPYNPHILSLMADVNILNDNIDAAQLYINQVREISPDSPLLHRVLSRLFLSKNRIDQAMESATKAVQEDKTRGANYVALAAVHCKQKNFDKAENFLNIALDLDPRNPEAQYYKAIIANQTQQYASSLRILKNVLDEYPSLDKCWYLLAQTYKEINRLKPALEAIDKAININPDNSIYYLLKSEVLPDLNRKEEAIELLKEYEKKFEPDAQYFTTLGFVNFRLAKYEETLQCLNRAIKLNPEYEKAYRDKAKLLTNMDKLEQAVDCYKKLLELSPNDAAVIAEIGYLYSSMAQNEKAVPFLDKAQQVNGDIPLPYLKKGQHYLMNLDEDNAKLMFQKAMELPYKSPAAYTQLARLKANDGQHSEALELINEAQRYFPGNPNIIAIFSDLVSSAPEDYPLSKSFLGKLHLNLANVWEKYRADTPISDDEHVKDFVNNVFNVLRSFKILNMPMQKSQIFRGNPLGINCHKCKSLFDYKNIIPEYCFGCYKIVLTFANLADCIRYNFYMDKLDPGAPIRRKLMIDSRGSSKGDLKGFYYTRDWEEAHRVCDYLKQVMAKIMQYEFTVKVKRGCSEFQDEFPDYNTLDENGNLVMVCPEDWKKIERDYFSTRNFNTVLPAVKYDGLGLTIFDAFVIRNWVRIRRSHGHDDFQFEEAASQVN